MRFDVYCHSLLASKWTRFLRRGGGGLHALFLFLHHALIQGQYSLSLLVLRRGWGVFNSSSFSFKSMSKLI